MVVCLRYGKVFVAVLVGVMILFSGVRVYGHSWDEVSFRVESENGEKVFIFNPSFSVYPFRQYPELPRTAVYYNTEPLRLAYYVDIAVSAPFWEDNLVFSKCFRYMVFMPARTWPDGTALEFYKDGILIKKYLVSDLVRYADTLAGNWLMPIVWEDWDRRNFNIETNQLSITTFDGAFRFTSRLIEGATFTFDITTGEIVARSPQMLIPIGGVFIGVVLLSAMCIRRRRKALQNLSEQPNLAK